jgi:hypothetical protein
MSDIVVTPANVIASTAANKIQVTFGEAVVAGALCYQNPTDKKYYNSIGTNSAAMPVKGIAFDGGAAGQPGFLITFDPDLAIGTHGAGVGIPLFASANAGKVCPFADLATGNLTTCIGVTNDSTTIYFNPTGGVGAHA